MKKKAFIAISACAALVAVVVATVWAINIYQREQDPNWQLVKKLYDVEYALQAIDGSWELDSLTKVTPYQYKDPDGDTITYYCCITAYVTEGSVKCAGIHKTALEQVVDIDDLENRRDCDVNGLEAIMGELDRKTYLCWTLSSTYSCVIEYVSGTISEADIIRMAESVSEAENGT